MARVYRPRINQPNAHTDENDAAKIVRLHREGRTFREIAIATGWSMGTVRNRLIEAGETFRPRGRKPSKAAPTRTSLVLVKSKRTPYADRLIEMADKMFQKATAIDDIKAASKLKEFALNLR